MAALYGIDPMGDVFLFKPRLSGGFKYIHILINYQPGGYFLKIPQPGGEIHLLHQPKQCAPIMIKSKSCEKNDHALSWSLFVSPKYMWYLNDNLEPETSTLKWLFQLDDSQSLHRKWLFHQTSIYKWFFGVPGRYVFFVQDTVAILFDPYFEIFSNEWDDLFLLASLYQENDG